ncbi:hypothetical protein BCR39DRAFT_591337 [Naematelia encephala]|uniref:BRCT domain-containing protein n=1 Tax=Naematelia encephala TaxID=71784 RepID=A0A1Y2AIH2_9TREE|nr:hypothetical protein BCR39DRAFT_591337 [Naematelia encephala]
MLQVVSGSAPKYKNYNMSRDPRLNTSRLSSAFIPRKPKASLFQGLDFYVQPKGTRMLDFSNVCGLIEDFGGRICSQPCHKGPIIIIILDSFANGLASITKSNCRASEEIIRLSDWTGRELVKYFGKIKGAVPDQPREWCSVLKADWLRDCVNTGTLVPKAPWEIVGEIEFAPAGPPGSPTMKDTLPTKPVETSQEPALEPASASNVHQSDIRQGPEVATNESSKMMISQNSGRRPSRTSRSASFELDPLPPPAFTIGHRSISDQSQNRITSDPSQDRDSRHGSPNRDMPRQMHTFNPSQDQDSLHRSLERESSLQNQDRDTGPSQISSSSTSVIDCPQSPAPAPLKQERFLNQYGLPVTFHVLGGRNKAIFDIVLKNELSGYLTTATKAQFIIVPAGADVNLTSVQVAVVRDAIVDPTRAAVTSDWIDACIEQQRILEHQPFKFILQENLPLTPSSEAVSADFADSSRKRGSPFDTIERQSKRPVLELRI